MASIARAAMKDPRNRRLSDDVRIQAGHMLTFDDLARRGGMAERHIMQRVLRKKIINNTGFLALPLTLGYFTLYCLGIFYHEDITNVFSLESLMRMRADDIFQGAESTDQLWESLMGSFLHTFFVQEDVYGNPLPKSVGGRDKWGLWGRVETHNQLQGAVRFTTSRKSPDNYGAPYTCSSNVTCRLCRSNTGFQRRGLPVQTDFDCGGWGETGTASAGGNSTGGRRLKLLRPELRTSLPQDADEEDTFSFFLYPTDSRDAIREALEYFRARGWLDLETTTMEIKMYLLNCELANRCRLEQFTLHFRFSEGGGIYYSRQINSVFLVIFSGPLNVMADICWFAVLVSTALFRARLAWKAFLRSELCEHFSNVFNAWEWVILLMGSFNVYGFYRLTQISATTVESLQSVRAHSWDLSRDNEPQISEMFDTVSAEVSELGWLREGMNAYVIILMFRFFVSFGAQPRLAVVTSTLKAVMTDMIHFVVVFLPTFVAYVVSGNLLFGRKFDGFATLQASFGTCFRIFMESEYEWETLSEDYYWSTVAWVWTFILLLVLLMLNMVLAIILDVYNEVREATHSKDAECIWDTVYNLSMRFIHLRNWVSERTLQRELANDDYLQRSIVSVDDLKGSFPDIPTPETDNLYADCQKDMKWAAQKDLDKRSLFQAAGSVQTSLERANKIVRIVNEEETRDPLHSWVSPHTHRTAVSATEGDGTLDTFLTLPASSKGGEHPRVLGPEELAALEDAEDEEAESCAGAAASSPPWLQEIEALLSGQRQWLRHAQWQLQQMQWQLQLAHQTRYPANDGGQMPVL